MRRSRIKAVVNISARRKAEPNIKLPVDDNKNNENLETKELVLATQLETSVTDASNSISVQAENEEIISSQPLKQYEPDGENLKQTSPSESDQDVTEQNTDNNENQSINVSLNIDNENNINAPFMTDNTNICNGTNILISREVKINENLNIPNNVTEPCIKSGNVNKESPTNYCNVEKNNDNLRTNQAENVCHTEYTSPTKIIPNRSCFMRPIPRFDVSGRIRRNSIQGSGASASESEDDYRKINNTPTKRKLEEQVMQSHSNKDVDPPGTQSNIIKFSSKQKKRMLISESARKLAEARREFLLKHENKTPDRTKLTMYDLIYYNPATNPMKKQSQSSVTKKTIVIPQEESDEEPGNDLTAIPAPQVKIGPDGQLVIDEKSLVIETSDAKKSREISSKVAIIDDDNTGNGFYKKRKKSKEWSKFETLKFYKALQYIGTNFLLIQNLLKNRTREEIKLKYKKEERVNPQFIEKALVSHKKFDIEILKQELAKLDEAEMVEEKEQQLLLKTKKEKKRTKARRKLSRRLVALSIGETSATEDELEMDSEVNLEMATSTISQSSKRPLESCNVPEQPCNEDTNIDHELEKETTISVISDSESESEVYVARPTRSGRLPKKKKRLCGPNVLEEISHNTINLTDDLSENHSEGHIEIIEDEILNNTRHKEFYTNANTDTPEAIQNSIPDIAQAEPGSLVIVSKESEDQPGEKILQVFMVSSDANNLEQDHQMTSIELPSHLLSVDKLVDADIVQKENSEC